MWWSVLSRLQHLSWMRGHLCPWGGAPPLGSPLRCTSKCQAEAILKGRLWGTTPSWGHLEAGQGWGDVYCPAWWYSEAIGSLQVSSFYSTTLFWTSGTFRGLSGCIPMKIAQGLIQTSNSYTGPPGWCSSGCSACLGFVLFGSDGRDRMWNGSPRSRGREPPGEENLSCLVSLSSSH